MKGQARGGRTSNPRFIPYTPPVQTTGYDPTANAQVSPRETAQKRRGGRPVTGDAYATQSQAKTLDHPYDGPIKKDLDNSLELLTDEQMKFFIFNGYLILKTQLPDAFHHKVYNHMETSKEPNPGNNILPALPCLNQVYEDPNIKGALVSLLGNNYIMHPHRFCHLTPPGKVSQKWHRDTFWGYVHTLRNPKLRYIMAMYYPQKTTLDMGPTGMKPGTQYYSVDPKYYKGDLVKHFSEDSESQDFYGEVEAGTVIFIHYDIIHKGSANLSKKNRYMFKFQFLRMEDPTEPTWNCSDLNWDAGHYGQGNLKLLEPICRGQWEWLCGIPTNVGENENMIDKTSLLDLTQKLDDMKEWNRYFANFSLVNSGQTELLLQRLKICKTEQLRINTVYALAFAQPTASLLEELVSLLKTQDKDLIQMVIYILGQYGKAASPALSRLSDFLNHSTVNIRAQACESIGIIGSGFPSIPQVIVQKLASKLTDTDGKVRYHCALALAQLGPSAECVINELIVALNDCNRYVQGYAIIALKRINTPRSLEIAFDYLFASRWCPITSPTAPY